MTYPGECHFPSDLKINMLGYSLIFNINKNKNFNNGYLIFFFYIFKMICNKYISFIERMKKET